MSSKIGEGISRRNLIFIGAGTAIGLAVLTIPLSSVGIPTRQSTESDTAFKNVLDRTRIRIYAKVGLVTRDIRDPSYSSKLEYGLGNVPWYSAFIRCDDADVPSMVEAKANILWGLYYNPHNTPDSQTNGWGDIPEVTCDTFYAGNYIKEAIVDNVPIHKFNPADGGSSAFAWIHYNLSTGEVKSWSSKFGEISEKDGLPTSPSKW